MKNKKPAKVIAITSGKGGVGKSSCTVNIGLSLAKQGKKVLILDADLGLANINILLGFKPAATIQELLKGTATLKEVIVKYADGLDILPATSGISELTNLSENERLALGASLEELSLAYDFVLVDTAAGIGDNVLYFNVAAEEIIVVLDSEPTSITDAYAVIKVLSTKHGVTEFNVLSNSTPIGTDGRITYSQLTQVSDKFLNVSLKYLGSIAEDSSVSEAVVKQRPCIELFPSAKASLDFKKVAQKILQNEGVRKSRGGLQFFFKEILQNS
jgi:flagellar biosynthesis protein FlhG